LECCKPQLVITIFCKTVDLIFHASQKDDWYYCVGELATPLLTMFESYYYGITGMSKDQLYIERDAFYYALKAVLEHPDNEECNQQYELLFWKSDPGIGNYVFQLITTLHFVVSKCCFEILLSIMNLVAPLHCTYSAFGITL
jgi:Transmembrane protein 173